MTGVTGGIMRRQRTVACVAIGLGVALLGLVAVAAEQAPSGQAGERAGGIVLSGSTRGAAGQALEGVTVSARAAGSTITTTVISNERGEFVFPPLPGGAYQVWAQAVGFGTARAAVTLEGARPATQAFTLQTIDDFTPQLTSSEWMAALPAATREDRRMRELFRVNCSECHSLSLALLSPFDEQGWLAIIERMDGMTGAEAIADGDEGGRAPRSTLAFHKVELAKYLARVRGPGASPLKFKLHPRPTGDAARVIMTEYAIPPARYPNELAWADGVDWSRGPASGQHGATGTHDVNIDLSGNAWVTESSRAGSRTITKVDSKTGQVTGYRWRVPGSNTELRAHGIGGKDAKGNLWFDTFGNLGKIDPATETFELFIPPPRTGGVTLTTDVDGKGFVWGASRYGAMRFDPATKKFKYFQSLTPADGNSYGVAGDAEGNGWWTTYWADILTMVDIKTGKSHEVPLNPPGAAERAELATPADREFYEEVGALKWSHINTVPGAIGPRRLGADKNGNSVWVPLFHSAAIANVDIKSRKATYYPLPFDSTPYFLVVDKNHVVWTNLLTDDRVARFDPKTEAWTFYRLPTHGCETRNIAVDDVRGDVWVPCIKASKIVRLQFPSAADLQALRTTGAVASR
jgi:streptogramin lyase